MRRPLHPIGKTQWSKWQDPARSTYNEEIAAGASFAQAVAAANEVQANTRTPKKSSLLDVLEETLEGIKAVAEVAEAAAPVIAVAKTVAKATKSKKKAK